MILEAQIMQGFQKSIKKILNCSRFDLIIPGNKQAAKPRSNTCEEVITVMPSSVAIMYRCSSTSTLVALPVKKRTIPQSNKIHSSQHTAWLPSKYMGVRKGI